MNKEFTLKQKLQNKEIIVSVSHTIIYKNSPIIGFFKIIIWFKRDQITDATATQNHHLHSPPVYTICIPEMG